VNLATISTLSNTNLASDDARLTPNPVPVPLPKPPPTAYCRQTTPKKAIDLSVRPNEHDRRDNQYSRATGYSGELHPSPSFLTTTGHTSTTTSTEREDDTKRIDPFESSTRLEGESQLVFSTVHFSSAATQLQTYARIENLENPLPRNICITDNVTSTIPLSAKGHKRKKSAWFTQQARTDNPHCQLRLPQASATPNNRSSASTITKTSLESAAAKRQWEYMRVFYSNTHLWPSMEGHNSTWIEGGSPLIWTMLHPPRTAID